MSDKNEEACDEHIYGIVYMGETTNDGRHLIGFDLGNDPVFIKMGDKWELRRVDDAGQEEADMLMAEINKIKEAQK